MKVAVLAGGKGTRFAEETAYRPKPLIEIGGRPILWHILKHYAAHGLFDFVVASGYKGDMIRAWAAELKLSGEIPHWGLEIVDTGAETNTGGRIRRLMRRLPGERIMLTWGDGVADVDLDALLAFHESHGRLATMTAVRPPPRFGRLELDGDRIRSFKEKPKDAEGWINGAFFVLEPEVAAYIEGDDTLFEAAPLETLAAEGQLMAYRHHGFWQCMDTLHDRKTLETLWARGDAPWARAWQTPPVFARGLAAECESLSPAIAATSA
ncbi:MAG: sugar phosphate nucleotidyltransferase [Pseudomonadota bacterium]